MLALGFGLGAALVWAVHDLLARKLSPGAAILPMLAVVLATGSLSVLPFAVAGGDWAAMTGAATAAAAVSGLAFAVAIGALYKALSLAPLRLVSPIVGSYPMLSLGIAAAQGQAVTGAEWLSVALIVAGIAIVCAAVRDDAPDAYAAPPPVAMGWSALSAVGFAITFALAQEATRQGSELPAILIGRLAALAAILILILAIRGAGAAGGHAPLPRRQLPVLALMGSFDALALGLVTASGGLPRAEYASVTSSLFGVLTVILGAWILRERVRAVQWAGIATVFTGVAGLSLQG